MSERAVILAGGMGTRLRPYTVVLPKPLMPVGEFPILEVIIRQLAHYGFGHITLAVNHQADIVKAFCGDGSKWNLRIDYSLESKPLSTIGPLRLIDDLPANFLLLNGDVLTDLNFGRLLQDHVSERRLFTLASSRRTQVVDYGVLHTDSTSALNGFEEKPKLDYLVSMGVYALNRSILDRVPKGDKYGFDHLMLDMLGRSERVQVHEHTGYWLDIGRVDDYMLAIEEFDSRRAQLLPSGI